MINKINTGSNLISKLYVGSTEVQKAYLGDKLIYGDALCFSADQVNSSISLTKVGTPTEANFEISTDTTETRTDYTIGDTITLANVGDTVYIRNKSETVVGLSSDSWNYYNFIMTGKIKASGDINFMLCKYSTTNLTGYCYESMFRGCTSLVQAPSLPATNLRVACYYFMFDGCTSLVQPPALPATTLANSCYAFMFIGCTSLVQAPSLPATTLVVVCYESMFEGCTSLVQLPALPATNVPSFSYRSMFEGCTKIKLSTTQTSEYTQPYRIPTTGTGTGNLSYMFTNTGGTFTGTPTVNTTYYLHKDNTIVG